MSSPFLNLYERDVISSQAPVIQDFCIIKMHKVQKRILHTVAYLEFGSRGGVPASPICSKGTISYYNNFIHSEDTISQHMAIFKKNTCKFFKYL